VKAASSPTWAAGRLALLLPWDPEYATHARHRRGRSSGPRTTRSAPARAALPPRRAPAGDSVHAPDGRTSVEVEAVLFLGTSLTSTPGGATARLRGVRSWWPASERRSARGESDGGASRRRRHRWPIPCWRVGAARTNAVGHVTSTPQTPPPTYPPAGQRLPRHLRESASRGVPRYD
jgi:hypothetical protein